jgi:penicillin-binding protein 1A
MNNGVFVRSGWPLVERKLKEMLVSVQLERRYTKAEILTLYANQINLGHGAYGVEAASRMYFDKSAKDLTVEEAATIAAIIQTPARLSPFVNPERTLARRNNYVLPRMAEEGFITREEAAEAAARPLVLQGQPTPDRSIAPYFVEDIRKVLEQKYGADALYQTGLRVQTTLDVDLQEAANAAIDRGLRVVDKRKNGFRRPSRNIVAEGKSLEKFTTERWTQPILAGDIVPALVTFVPGPTGGSARVRIGEHDVELKPSAFAWTRRTSAATLFKVGDLIEVNVRTLEGRRPVDLLLEQPPAVEGALVAIDNHTGQIRAMVGGFSFARSKFNRASQARRPGRLAVQAVRVHGGDRSRLYLNLDLHRRARLVRGGPQSAPVPAAQLRPQIRGPRHAAARARAVPQYSGRESDGGDRTQRSRRLRETLRPEGRLPAVPLTRARLRRVHAG